MDSGLFQCVMYNDVEGARRLLDKGANPNIQNDDGTTPLLYALRLNANSEIVEPNYEMVELLLKYDADPNIQNDDGKTPLLYILHRNANYELVELLLEYGADPNIQDDFGTTPLHRVAINRKFEIAKLLLEHGADPDIPNVVGFSSLDIAFKVSRSDKELINLLQSYSTSASPH